MRTTCMTVIVGLAVLSAPYVRAEGPAKMDVDQAQKTRYNGTVLIWYGSHFEDTAAHDWEPIKEWNGPYHPLLGNYKTNDLKVLRQHLHWLRRAGVDVIVYDLCRIQPELTMLELSKQETLQLLIQELSHQEKETRKLQLVLWIEKWNSNPTPEQYRFGMEYIRKNLAPHDFYFRLGGKPLVLTYLNGKAPAEIDEIDRQYQSLFTLRRVTSGRPSGSQWAYIGFAGDNRECATVSPGADGYLENAFIAKYVNKRSVDDNALRQHGRKVSEGRKDGHVMESQLLLARQADPPLIFISGWNDWAYMMQIEPAVEYGLKYVDTTARLLGRQTETLPYRQAE